MIALGSFLTAWVSGWLALATLRHGGLLRVAAGAYLAGLLGGGALALLAGGLGALLAAMAGLLAGMISAHRLHNLHPSSRPL